MQIHIHVLAFAFECLYVKNLCKGARRSRERVYKHYVCTLHRQKAESKSEVNITVSNKRENNTRELIIYKKIEKISLTNMVISLTHSSSCENCLLYLKDAR